MKHSLSISSGGHGFVWVSHWSASETFPVFVLGISPSNLCLQFNNAYLKPMSPNTCVLWRSASKFLSKRMVYLIMASLRDSLPRASQPSLVTLDLLTVPPTCAGASMTEAANLSYLTLSFVPAQAALVLPQTFSLLRILELNPYLIWLISVSWGLE